MCGVLMPYLICDKCNVSYEIENRNEMNDFHTCDCGNGLKYYSTIEEYIDEGLEDSDIANDSINDPGGDKKGVFYSIDKKNLVTLQMEMLKEDKERKEKARLRRDLNYRINHAIAEKKEKMSNSSKIQNYKPLIAKELEDEKENERLLNEMELLKGEEEENVNVKGDLKKQINFDGLLIAFFGFVWIISISYAFYLFLMAISTLIFGLMILIVTHKNYYSKSRLRWIYGLNGINLAIFGFTALIFIILALIQDNSSLFAGSYHYSRIPPAIFVPILIVILSGALSYLMFRRAALPDYPDKLHILLNTNRRYVDVHEINDPIYEKQKLE